MTGEMGVQHRHGDSLRLRPTLGDALGRQDQPEYLWVVRQVQATSSRRGKVSMERMSEPVSTPYGETTVEDLVGALEAEVAAHRATRRELDEARNLIAAMQAAEK